MEWAWEAVAVTGTVAATLVLPGLVRDGRVLLLGFGGSVACWLLAAEAGGERLRPGDAAAWLQPATLGCILLSGKLLPRKNRPHVAAAVLPLVLLAGIAGLFPLGKWQFAPHLLPPLAATRNPPNPAAWGVLCLPLFALLRRLLKQFQLTRRRRARLSTAAAKFSTVTE